VLKKFLNSLVILLLLCGSCFAGVHFDDVNTYLESSNNMGITGSQNRTLCEWVKMDSGASYGMVGSGWSDGGGTGQEFYFLHDSETLTRIAIASGNRIWDMDKSDNKVHLICAVLDGSSTASLTGYIDGEVASISSTVTRTLNTVSDKFFVGYYIRNSANPFGGNIHAISAWNTALTQEEIQLWYNSKIALMPLQIQPDNLKGFWILNECPDGVVCSGTDQFYDLSGNGLHLTASNSPVGVAETILSYP